MNPTNTTDLLQQLQKWYQIHCDGNWEHGHGIQLSTLDNPGWDLAIDLGETELEERPFIPVLQHLDSDTWMRCEVKDKCFTGCGGVTMLANIVECFLIWESGVDKKSSSQE